MMRISQLPKIFLNAISASAKSFLMRESALSNTSRLVPTNILIWSITALLTGTVIPLAAEQVVSPLLYHVSGTAILERHSEFPNYVFFWTIRDPKTNKDHVLDIGPELDRLWMKGGFTPWALPKAVYDSAFAAMNMDSAYDDPFVNFLLTDSRSQRAKIATPWIDAGKIGEWYWLIQDVVLIDKLDSASFDVTLTQATYYSRDGTTEVVHYGRGHWDREKQQTVYKRPIPKSKQELSRPFPYTVLALVSLVVLIIGIMIVYRRNKWRTQCFRREGRSS